MALMRQLKYRLRPSRLLSYIASFLIALYIFYNGFGPSDTSQDNADALARAKSCFHGGKTHPIEELMCYANEQHYALLDKKTSGVASAAARYRQLRQRHPPPGFDKWVEFAESKNALIIEELFDQIYADLEPFWGVDTNLIRSFSRSYYAVISIRNGKPRRWAQETPQFIFMTERWMDMISGIPSENLPDVDMAFNIADEPHLFVSWEEINEYMAKAMDSRHTRRPTKSQPIYSDYSKYGPLPENFPPEGFHFPHDHVIASVWDLTRRSCHPDSLTRSAPQDKDMTLPARFPSGREKHFHRGFVANWTQAKSACDTPYLANMHGSFIHMQLIEPNNPTVKESYPFTQLVPLFSGCKLQSTNNDILIPAAVYWPGQGRGKDGFSHGPDVHVPWEEQKSMLKWRGSASGGWNNDTTWTRFHRHRLLSMLNHTQVTLTERSRDSRPSLPKHVPGGRPVLPHNFPLPEPSVYDLAALKRKPSDLGRWIKSLADAKFVDLRCFPPYAWFGSNSATCPYSGPWYRVVDKEIHSDAFKYKYSADLDGASFSGRYLGLLSSDSVPLKATVYAEWHDSRLMPWRHFVPMDNSLVDLWGILEYFLGYKNAAGLVEHPPHDLTGKTIGAQGRDWVDTALREEDMVIYMYRLILEFARISDDRRLNMGYTGDL